MLPEHLPYVNTLAGGYELPHNCLDRKFMFIMFVKSIIAEKFL
jgi:hypothetical protein